MTWSDWTPGQARRSRRASSKGPILQAGKLQRCLLSCPDYRT